MNLIFRITDNCSDVEILMHDEIEKKEYFKAICLDTFIKSDSFALYEQWRSFARKPVL